MTLALHPCETPALEVLEAEDLETQTLPTCFPTESGNINSFRHRFITFLWSLVWLQTLVLSVNQHKHPSSSNCPADSDCAAPPPPETQGIKRRRASFQRNKKSNNGNNPSDEPPDDHQNGQDEPSSGLQQTRSAPLACPFWKFDVNVMHRVPSCTAGGIRTISAVR